jgi:hypothetical protein
VSGFAIIYLLFLPKVNRICFYQVCFNKTDRCSLINECALKLVSIVYLLLHPVWRVVTYPNRLDSLLFRKFYFGN